MLNLGVLFGNEIAEIMLTETEGLNNVIVSAYTGCTSFTVSTSITYVITANCQYTAASQTFYVSLSVESLDVSIEGTDVTVNQKNLGNFQR